MDILKRALDLFAGLLGGERRRSSNGDEPEEQISSRLQRYAR